MFDVVWANPERELVGQRKARKEKEKEKKDASSSGSRSIASAETGSSTRSKQPQSFLESIRLKKKKPKHDTQSLSPSSRISSLSENRESLGVPQIQALSLGRSGSIQHGDGSLHGDQCQDPRSSQILPLQDEADSILTKWTIPKSLATMLSLDEDTALELLPKESYPTVATTPVDNDTAQTVIPMPSGNDQEVSATSQCPGQRLDEVVIFPAPPLTPVSSPGKSLKSSLTPSSLAFSRRATKTRASSPPPSYPATRSGRNQQEALSTLNLRSLSVRSSPTSWNAIEPWENSSFPAPLVVGTEASTRSSSGTGSDETRASTATSQDDRCPSLSLNLSGMQREILQMASADQDTFWRRLTEEWGSWADAALYRELEMEKKRWLLSALYSISPAPDTRDVRIASAERRILVFFETQATASYIAALNAGVPVHHMSPNPLSNKLFPNVSPMQSNTMSRDSLSTAPQVFSDIYVQALPALMSAIDLPVVLRNMHRVLKPQGALHLLLIDPSPARCMTGPRLQAWLDEHLLLNLERLFRCTSPTRLFPTWLRDAHFQLADEAKIVCSFPAVQQGNDSNAVPDAVENNSATLELPETLEPDFHTDKAQTQKTKEEKIETQVKGRLHTLVGQKLWQEVWGPYVTADKWWWEDEACREECIRMGTVWEYHIIDAVKKERYLASQL